MAVLMIEYSLPTDAVTDYVDWKQVFDTDPIDRKAHGATRHWIYREDSEPNHFMVSIEFPTTEATHKFLNEPMLQGSWEVSGARRGWVLQDAEAVVY
jgi:hypothetical protein